MELEFNTGGEQDYCECGNSGDDTILNKVVGTNKFLCSECENKLRNAYDIVNEIEAKYKTNKGLKFGDRVKVLVSVKKGLNGVIVGVMKGNVYPYAVVFEDSKTEWDYRENELERA